jgi:hypothetical protein
MNLITLVIHICELTCSILSLPIDLYHAMTFDKVGALTELVNISESTLKANNELSTELITISELLLDRHKHLETHSVEMEALHNSVIKSIDAISLTNSRMWANLLSGGPIKEDVSLKVGRILADDSVRVNALLTELTTTYVGMCSQTQLNIDTGRSASLALTLNACVDILNDSTVMLDTFNAKADQI